MLRAGFDPDRPLIATSAFESGMGTIAAGAEFDWRSAGVSEHGALAMFQSGLLAHSPALTAAPTAPPAAAAQAVDAPTTSEVTLAMPGVATVELAENIKQRELAATARPEFTPAPKHRRR